MSVMDVIESWAAVSDALGLATPIRDESHYEELLAFVDEAFERFGNDESHPVFGLVSIVADRIREYEDRVHPWPQMPPHEFLRQLMTERDIRQSDLPEVGSQSVVSEVLSGKRSLNLRQVKALSERFNLPMEAFVR
jgi:HTH-type transcriptional regulator/antitoxin HigA